MATRTPAQLTLAILRAAAVEAYYAPMDQAAIEAAQYEELRCRQELAQLLHEEELDMQSIPVRTRSRIKTVQIPLGYQVEQTRRRRRQRAERLAAYTTLGLVAIVATVAGLISGLAGHPWP